MSKLWINRCAQNALRILGRKIHAVIGELRQLCGYRRRALLLRRQLSTKRVTLGAETAPREKRCHVKTPLLRHHADLLCE